MGHAGRHGRRGPHRRPRGRTGAGAGRPRCARRAARALPAGRRLRGGHPRPPTVGAAARAAVLLRQIPAGYGNPPKPATLTGGIVDGGTQRGSLVGAATGVLGGLGFYVRADRSIWTFVDGQPLLVRRREHWTAFPLELTAAIVRMIGRCTAAALVARAAFMISAQPRSGAILAIVDQGGMATA